MRISFSATNPCHVHPLARAVAERGALGTYYSGYPLWKLPASEQMRIRPHSWRTNLVYGAMKYLPDWARPETRWMYRWQDDGFDRWVGRHLESCDFIHAMPGQALHTFKQARRLGIRTVLNHATGPVREWMRIMEPEYVRVGLKMSEFTPYDASYLARENAEYELSDFHCAASSVVRAQLESIGIAHAKILLVPYGADSSVFFPPAEPRPAGFRIVFAGMAGLRKGMRCLLQALESSERAEWTVDFFGAVLPEAKQDFQNYRGKPRLIFHGAVSQTALAEAFRRSSVLVLPSLEEGFGLVVPQALSTGLPCIVSDHVGGKDLIGHRRNGSIFPVGDSAQLLGELFWWETNSVFTPEDLSWSEPAAALLSQSRSML